MVDENLSVSKLFSNIRFNYQYDLLIFLVFLAVSLLISYRNIDQSGVLWPDASQYANAGAMIHDWLISGNIFRPYSFAKQNYSQYPAFHIPYHPPAYPGLLGSFFLITGVGYAAARFFIALCLAIAGCFFYALLKTHGLSRITASLGGLVLMTVPEIAFWSRDTMSEIPALALIISACYYFSVWMKNTRLRYFVIAACLAEAAFLSRYLAAGVLVAWLLWMPLFGNWRRLITKPVVIAGLILLLINAGWMSFAVSFSKYETPFGGVMPNTNYVPMFSVTPLGYYFRALPQMIGWPILIAALAAAAYLLYAKAHERLLFWLCWLVGYTFFVMSVGIFNEQRYFLFALPVFPGLIAEVVDRFGVQSRRGVLAVIIVGICLISNGYTIKSFPRGVVGYEAVGQALASLEDRGNVLVATSEQADLIFRFRSHSPHFDRTFIRADRTLFIRGPSYSDVKPIKIAEHPDDVLNIIRLGRVRYLVTSSPVGGAGDDRSEEMITLENIVRSQPETFVLIKTFPLLREYSRPGNSWQVFLWRFLGELPESPSELPVLIPTAEMEIKPSS